MLSDRFAVIDLGSNTFHLLIVEVSEEQDIQLLYKERIYVKLGSGGLDFIPEENIQRGIDAMVRFAARIESLGVYHVRAIGTAALREASNGKEVVQRFTEASGLSVEVIDGQQEAQYILEGIKAALPVLDRPALIMDIGGGSVEFILFDQATLLFKGSYKIGVAVLYRMFHHSDPMHDREIADLEHFLDRELPSVLKAADGHSPYYLIGASGSFEVIHDVMPRLQSGEHWAEITLEGMEAYLNEVISTNLTARREIPEIPIERLDYIVVAYLLIRYILKNIPPQKLFYCDFALKEGVLSEMLSRAKF